MWIRVNHNFRCPVCGKPVVKYTKGQHTLILHSEDECIIIWDWTVHSVKYTNYLRRLKGSKYNRIAIYLHRQLLSAPKNLQVDHINGNGLDNCRCNLRLATKNLNMLNLQQKSHSNTGHRNIYYLQSDRKGNHYKYYVIIKYKHKEQRGGFETLKEAIKTRDIWRKEVLALATQLD